MKSGFDRLRGAAAVSAAGLGMLASGTARPAPTTLAVTLTRSLLATVGATNLSATALFDNFELDDYIVSNTTGTPVFRDAFVADTFNAEITSTTPNGFFFDNDGVVDLTGDTLTTTGSNLVAFALNAETQLTLIPRRNASSLGVIRALFSMTNTGTAASNESITIEGHLQSGGNTVIQATASGDAILDEKTDQWIYTNESPLGNDPVVGETPGVTFARFGSGAALLPNGSIGNSLGLFTARFDLSIPPGATHRIMLFLEVSATNAAAVANATDFESRAALEAAGLTVGLSNAVLDEVINYSTTLPAGTGGAGGGAGGAGGGPAAGSGLTGDRAGASSSMDLAALLTALGSILYFRRQRIE